MIWKIIILHKKKKTPYTLTVIRLFSGNSHTRTSPDRHCSLSLLLVPIETHIYFYAANCSAEITNIYF